MSDWTLTHLETIDDGFDNIEIFFASHNTVEMPFSALVIRTSAPGAHVASEVWISENAIRPLVSVLEANRPGQLQLFDQDAM